MELIAKFESMHKALMRLTHGRLFLQSGRLEQLRLLTRRCAEQLQVPRVSVWYLGREKSDIICEILYSAKRGGFEQGMVLKRADFPNYFAAMEEDRLINAADAEQDPRTREFRDSYLRPTGIKSMLDAPIFFDGRLFGVLCLEQTGEPRDWDLAELSYVTAVADTVSLMNEHSAWLESEKRVEHLANYDQLTGLANRNLMEMHIGDFLEEGSPSLTLSLITIGLDRFKQFNDAYGYHVGNELLQKMAERLKQSTEEYSRVVSRLGGDEFSLLLEGVGDRSELDSVVDVLRESLTRPMNIDKQQFVPSVSIGVARYPDDTTSGEALMRYSESAVNLAKSSGRGTKAYYHHEWNNVVKERIQLEREVRQAFSNNELEVFYQPIVDSKTYRTVAFEALIRWHHPQKGLQAPGFFLDAMKQAGLMGELGDFVFASTCRNMARLSRLAEPLKYVSVNLSADQLEDEQLVDRVKGLLQAHDLRACLIEFEVIEEVIGMEAERVVSILHRLSDLGVNLAIDDFGTGHSSLSRLKKLPVNKIKIDKSFVDGLPDDPGDQSISRSIIGLARGLELKLVAEGVETAEQADWLVAEGCDYLQGYHFRRPLSLLQLEGSDT